MYFPISLCKAVRKYTHKSNTQYIQIEAHRFFFFHTGRPIINKKFNANRSYRRG